MNQPQQPVRAARPVQATRILVGLTLAGALVFAASIALVVWLVAWERGGKVNEGSFLEIELAGEVPDAPMTGGLFLEPEDFPPIVTDIAWSIREAKDDERILGLHLVLDSPAIGWAGYRELRDAIGEFREAGKPCVVYSEVYTTGTWYLASACDEIVMAPAGVGLVNGISATVTYYAGTFEKFGVKADMLHVGDFKSAVEPYERTEPSEPAALAMNEMLDGLWDEFLEDVSASRGLAREEVQALIDTPAMSPSRALERGLVDAIAYADAVRARAHAVKDEGWVESLAAPVTEDPEEVDEKFTSLKEYLKGLRAEQADGEARIAIVYASGPILGGEAEGGIFGEQVLADRTFAEWMQEIREDESIEAVVLRVNSPGGSGLASDNMWRELQATKADGGKPLVVSMANYAASGGYYISAPADWIVAQPNTLTGSIGVFGGKLVFGGTLEQLRVTRAEYERGAQADLLSVTEPFDEAGRAVYQGYLDDFYETFLARVAEGRKLDRDTVHAVAQGRVWTGEQALERKLVDELGGLDEAVAKAAELAGVTEYGIARWPKEKGFVEVLLEDLEQGSAVRLEVPGVPGVETEPLTDLLVLQRILATGAAALVPGDLRLSE